MTERENKNMTNSSAMPSTTAAGLAFVLDRAAQSGHILKLKATIIAVFAIPLGTQMRYLTGGFFEASKM